MLPGVHMKGVSSRGRTQHEHEDPAMYTRSDEIGNMQEVDWRQWLLQSCPCGPYLLSLHPALFLKECLQRTLGAYGALKVDGGKQEAAVLSLSFD